VTSEAAIKVSDALENGAKAIANEVKQLVSGDETPAQFAQDVEIILNTVKEEVKSALS